MDLNEDLGDFGDYSAHYYVHRVQLWVRSYQHAFGIPSEGSEALLHARKRVQRVDRMIGAPLKIIRDKIYSRMISLARGRTASRSRRGFFQRHKCCVLPMHYLSFW